jgi:hypothetical protein
VAAYRSLFAVEERGVQGKITIELTRRQETRETASDLPDLEHDAYWFAKQVRDLVWTSKVGEEVRMGDYDEVTAVRVATGQD